MVEYEVLPEDFMLRFFPRNLSYSEESYLDNYSICTSYINVPKSKSVIGYFENKLRNHEFEFLDDCDCCYQELDRDLLEIRKVRNMDAEGTSVDPVDSPKGNIAQIGSEEGIFVNMMDDLDSVESQTTAESPDSRISAGSDLSYFSLESTGSPEPQDMKPVDQECLSKAVSMELQRSDMRKTVSDGSLEVQDDSKSSNNEIKKTNSAESFETKFAHLKIEMKGESLTGEGVRKYLLPVESPVYDEPEFNFNRAELRKSSSLKSNKTPPGTPGRKKMVRFADAMGLDLESIRHVLDAENPPRIPASAIKDLKVGVEQERQEVGSRYLDLCFPQPCADPNFVGKVMANKVSLENCVINDMAITGVVRVANIGYHKCVRVRYSINNWVTFYDVMASYVQNSCDGATDRFSFTIVAPNNVGPGSKISFAISFTVNDMIYWDSNDSKNYEILCFAKTTPTDLEASWVHFV